MKKLKQVIVRDVDTNEIIELSTYNKFGIEVERRRKNFFEATTCDKNGNVTYKKTIRKNKYYNTNMIREEFNRFDENNNLLWKKIFSPTALYGNIEFWQEHDVNGNIIHYKDSNGLEIVSEYDENNNEIYKRTINTGLEEWFEYDDQGREIYYKNNEGSSHKRIFDSDGNLIEYYDNDSHNIIEYEYFE